MQPTAEQYLKILDFYSEALHEPVESPTGSRFEFVFGQIMRLLAQPSLFNESLPAPFLDVAWRYSAGDPATLRHFAYDENRQFFLSDLHDYIVLATKRGQSA